MNMNAHGDGHSPSSADAHPQNTHASVDDGDDGSGYVESNSGSEPAAAPTRAQRRAEKKNAKKLQQMRDKGSTLVVNDEILAYGQEYKRLMSTCT
jgi:hypothetical protein